MFISYYQISEQSFLIDYGSLINIETNNKVITHFKYIEKLNYKFIFNVVPSFNKLLIQFDPYYKKKIIKLLDEIKFIKNHQKYSLRKHIIEICYDHEFALDFKQIEKYSNINFNQFIDIHLKTKFIAFMIGFLPGLPFLGKMNFNYKIPRIISPRKKVPKGSVGIVDNLCVIYPNESPGGWNIIGKTKKKLFDLDYSKLSIISPGDEVKFKKISKKDFLSK